MLRTLPIFVALLLFVPSVAWGVTKDCTLCTGDWGDITTLSCNGGECDEVAAAPDNDDIIIVPDTAEVDIITDITFGDDGSAIEVHSGGMLTANATTADGVGDAIVITLFDGQDTNPSAELAVALWGEAGSTINLQGGYLERDVDATPILLETVSEANGNIWTVDLVTTCDPGDENTVGGELGGQEDCADGDEEKLFTLAYTDARNNPDQTDADNFLEEAVTAIATDYLIYFITGMDAGHVYSLESVDSTAAVYNITLDVQQIPATYTNDAFPVAMRNQVLLTTEDAGQKGDTCIESAASAIAASGDLVGACAYFYDATGDNGWSRPLRISKTQNALDCTGAAGNDAFHFAAESPLLADIVDASQVVISPTCIARGDKFAVLAPVVLSCEASRADGECKMYFSGDTTMHGVLIDGAGEVTFDGATVDLDNVHCRACGNNNAPAIRFLDMQNVSMACSSVVGGPKAGAGTGIEFDGVTGHTSLTDVPLRYIGGDQFYAAPAGDASGVGKFERISCERIAHVGTATGDSCFEDAASKWSYVGIQDLFFLDGSIGNNGSVIETEDSIATLNGVAVFGQTQGGLSRNTRATNLKTYNLYGRGVVGGRGTSVKWGDLHLSHCDIDDMNFSAGSGNLMSNLGATFENCIVKNMDIAMTSLFSPTDASGAMTIRNNILFNTNALDGSGNVISIDATAGSTTVHTIEDNSILWDEPSQWDGAIGNIAGDQEATTNTINFGGNLVDGFDNDDAATAIAIHLQAGLIDGIVYRAGRNNCVSSAVVTGGGTIEYVDDLDVYTTTPILGVAPDYDAIGLGKGALRTGSYLAEKKCGSRTGAQQPGMGPGHDWLYERMGIEKPKRDLITQKPQAF